SSVTKHSYLVTKIEQLPRVIHEAFHIATTGRPGPVLIDICKDVQMAEAERVNTEYFEIPGYKLNGHVNLEGARQAATALAGGERQDLHPWRHRRVRDGEEREASHRAGRRRQARARGDAAAHRQAPGRARHVAGADRRLARGASPSLQALEREAAAPGRADRH